MGWINCNALPRSVLTLFPALIVLASLIGCGTTPSNVYVPICISIIEYDPMFLNRAADELDELPTDSAIARLIEDYQHERDRLRACQEVDA